MRVRALLTAMMMTSVGLLAGPVSANDTTFTYQGRLTEGGALADGFYDATFRLYSVPTGGSLLGTVGAGFEVVDGVFSVELDFGAGSWNNSDRWLEITVNGSTLSPRQPVTRAPYAITTRGLHVDSEGRVGIGGTATSSNMLTIRDENADLLMLSQGNNFGPTLTFRNSSSSLIGTVHGNIIFDDGAQLAAIGYVKPGFGPHGLQFSGANDVHMKITETGFIGIGGELDPLAPLHYRGTDLSMSADAILNDAILVETSDAVLGLYSTAGGSRGSALALGEVSGGVLTDKWGIGRNTSPSGSALYFKYGTNPNYAENPTKFVIGASGDVYVPAGGRLGVGTSNPAVALHVNGNARVDVLEIVGADLAEKFPTSTEGEIEPGTVLEIDPENPGMLRVASTPRSTLVAGVVSGANGLSAGTIMGNLPGSDDHAPVALSGRVWVRCVASSGEIVPGTMLTTSSTPGHAMAAGDAAGAAGAIIGKAMTGLDRGESGLVLVLVNLQ